MPPDVAKAQAVLDAASASWPDEERRAWMLYRGYARKQERISQSALPAMGTAAQEMILARDHAHRALDAMSGVFGQDTDKHERLPGDPSDER
jgi:hypothetical protein